MTSPRDASSEVQQLRGRVACPEVARISQLLSKEAQEWQQIIEEQAPGMPSAVANMRCGMTGVSRTKESTSTGAGRVPVDVLDAPEEDLGVGEGEERVDAREDGSRNRFDRSECQGTVIDVDTDDEQPLVCVRDRWCACAISDEDPVFRSVELGTVADSSIPVPSTMQAESLLPTWLDGNQSPRYAKDESLVSGDRDSEHVVAVRASSVPPPMEGGENGCFSDIFIESHKLPLFQIRRY